MAAPDNDSRTERKSGCESLVANAGLPEFVAPLSTFWRLKKRKNFPTRVNKSKLAVTVNRLIRAADKGVVKQTCCTKCVFALFSDGPRVHVPRHF